MFKKCLMASAISLLALNATAQSSFSELIVFGDSLLDSGNDGGVKATNEVSPGVFAPIAPELLANWLNLSLSPAATGGTNYAVGGYQTADILETIAGNPVGTPNGGLRVPSGDPTVRRLPYLIEKRGKVNPNALVLMDGGGNDLRRILAPDRIDAVTAAATPVVTADVTAEVMSGDIAAADAPAEIAARVTALVADDISSEIGMSARTYVNSIGALHASGAKYIMVTNAPDLGITPGIQLGLSAGALDQDSVDSIAAATAGFNGGLETLATLGLSDANIIPVDLKGALNYVMENAEGYGFAAGVFPPALLGGLQMDQRYMCYEATIEGGQPNCLEHPIYGKNSVGTPGDTKDPRKLIFNDNLHPTEIMSEIFGDYMIDILAAPNKVGLLPEAALSASRSQVTVAGNELRRSRWSAGQGRLFVTGDVARDQPDLPSSPEAESQSVTVGRTLAATDSVIVGASFTASKQDLDIDAADFSATSWGVSGLLGYRHNGIFVDTVVGLSVLSYDGLERDVKLGSRTLTAKGDTEGRAWSLDVLAGFDLLPSDKWHLAPVAGVRYTNTTVEAYTESGGAVSNYRWGEQNRKSVQWRYGVVSSVTLGKGVELFAELLSSKEQENSAETMEITNTNLNVPSYRLPSYKANSDVFMNATVGGSVNIAKGASLNLTINHSDRGDGYDNVMLSYSMPM